MDSNLRCSSDILETISQDPLHTLMEPGKREPRAMKVKGSHLSIYRKYRNCSKTLQKKQHRGVKMIEISDLTECFLVCLLV